MVERVARYGNDFNDVRRGPGFLSRAAGAVARNPVRTVAGLVIVVGTIAITANAIFFQTGEHPSPLFTTRAETPAAAAAPAAAPVAPPAPTTDEVGRLVELTMVEPPPVRTAPASALVVEAQQLLTAQGYEPGTIDGLFGARTRTAIEAYQQAQNLAVTGEVTEALLERLRETAAAAPPAAAEPAVAAAPPVTATAPAIAGRPTEAATILAVQTALNQTGFGPIAATGAVSTETANAIRRFQLDQGLTPTGQVDEALIARMTAIGALE